MRHQVHKHTFSRRMGPRLALIRGMVASLVEHGRIRTTLPKAKEIKRHVEKAITLGKDGTVHARRLLTSRFHNEETVKALVDDLGKRFATRAGGYTRVIKLEPRPGDNAPMAYLEFVDYQIPEKSDAETTVKGDKTEKLKVRKIVKKNGLAKKTLRRLQSKARKVARA